MQTPLVQRAFSLALIFAAGCTGMVVRSDESSLLFSPRVADAEITFAVVDRRPAEAKVFRTGDLYGVESFFYGDSQFFPNRDRALTTRFADAFPDTPHDAALIVERLDIGHRVLRGPSNSQGNC